ncbi:MAG: hypothetical protein JWM02_2858 [Frankiales bacterium]|nr:hypothetical protein [Frankiales bacterium]
MALHPVGPLPVSTYWRRRAVLLVGVLVLLLVVRSCAAGGTPRRAAVTSTARATASPTASPLPTRTTAPPAATAALCTDSALTLSSTTDAATYGLGATPRITLTIKNSSATACRRDLGSGAVELLVFSGADRIWSSADCSPSTASSRVTLPPGGTQAVIRIWPGTRSAPGCGGTKAAALAGTYKVVARVGTLRQDGVFFRLHG